MGTGGLLAVVGPVPRNLIRPPDDPTRVPGGQDIRRDVSGNYAARPDSGVVSDGDARTDDGAAPDPHVVTDRDGFRQLGPLDPLLGLEWVGRGVDVDTRAASHIRSEADPGTIEDRAVEVQIEMIPSIDVAAVFTEERRLDLDASPCAAEKLAQQGLSFRDLFLGRLVEAARQAPDPLAIGDELGVRGEVELSRQHLLLFATMFHRSFLSGRGGCVIVTPAGSISGRRSVARPRKQREMPAGRNRNTWT